MENISYGVCSFEKLSSKLIECKSLAKIPKNAKSVIVGIFPYLVDNKLYEGSEISKYACVKDYHLVIKEYLIKEKDRLSALYPNDTFEIFVDSSPIPEVYAAALAGLGVIGDNGLLITEKYGSFVFIGEIITTADITQTGDGTIHRCLHCGKCKAVCPTFSLSDGEFNREKCLSNITQKKGELSLEESSLIKKTGCIWGCDICQNVCPLNKDAQVTFISEFLSSFSPVLSLDGDISDRAYAWRGKKVIERNLKLL